MNSRPINCTPYLNALNFVSAFICMGFVATAQAELVLDQNLSALPLAAPQSEQTIRSDLFKNGEKNTRLPVRLTPKEMSQRVAASSFSLADLTDLALRNNPATREVWGAAQAQLAALGIAEAGKYPTIEANFALTRGMSSINTSSGVVSGTTQTRFSPSINLNYVLFDFGASTSTVRAARETLMAANLAQDRSAQDVVFKVEQAYYQLLAARQTIVAAEETLKTAQLSFDVANERRLAGLATLGDVYQAETSLAQARLQLRKTQGEAGKFKGALCNAVGLPVNATLTLTEWDAPVPTQEVRKTIEHYLDQAKKSRPDLAAAEAQVRAAHFTAEAVSAQDNPTWALTLSGGKTYNNFPDNRFNNGSSNATIGINLNVPLFGGYRSTNLIRQAQARAELLNATQERIASQIELEVWQAYFDLDTSAASIDSARALFRSANQAREVAQARYQAGVGNLPVLLTAQANEANARMEVIQAEMGWYANLSRLNNAIGQFSTSGKK